MHTETDKAASELIHHHEHPMAFQANRFTSEQIDTPETVLHVAYKGEPRRAIATGFWTIVFSQYTSDDMLINLDVETFSR